MFASSNDAVHFVRTHTQPQPESQPPTQSHLSAIEEPLPLPLERFPRERSTMWHIEHFDISAGRRRAECGMQMRCSGSEGKTQQARKAQ